MVTEAALARDLGVISRKLAEVLAGERAAALDGERRLAQDQTAIENLLHAVEEAKAGGRWRNTRFNIFDVLGRPRLEQAHSSFLAWLFDPAEAHGFDDTFLRQFVQSALGTELPSTQPVTVVPEFEWGDCRFDVHVEGPGWCLVVENKIDDSPWASQRARYEAYCTQRKKRGQQAWLVYITPETRRPSRRCGSISYREVGRILETLVPCAPAAPLIEHFCEHIFTDLET